MTNDGNAVNAAPEHSNRYIYCAAALGAFFLAFGDLLNNNHAAMVLKISEILRVHVYQGFDGALALLLVTVLGGLVCFIHQPRTRIDAFASGFSVFAILSVTTPYQASFGKTNEIETKAAKESTSFLFREAMAQSIHPLKKPEAAANLSTAVISLRSAEQQQDIPYTNVILRDAATARVLAFEKVTGSTFVLLQPTGKYLVELEVPGHRRTAIDLSLSAGRENFVVELQRSRVPLSIQRLVSPAEGGLLSETAQFKPK